MKAPKYRPTIEKIWDAFDRTIAWSNSNAHLVRSDGLSRTTAEEWAQRGGLREVVNLLNADATEWWPNITVHSPKDDGSFRIIEIPAIRVQVASEALRQYVENIVPIPDGFYAIGNSNHKAGTHAANRLARECVESASEFLRLDIRQFFPSIDHELLRQGLDTILHAGDVDRLMTLVTLPSRNPDSAVENRSVGISQGNPLSSLLAHFFIRDFPGALADLVDHQVWFVDDFILIPKKGVTSEAILNRVIELLAEIKLVLKTSYLDEVIVRDECKFLGEILRISCKQLCPEGSPLLDETILTFGQDSLEELIEKSRAFSRANLGENHSLGDHIGLTPSKDHEGVNPMSITSHRDDGAVCRTRVERLCIEDHIYPVGTCDHIYSQSSSAKENAARGINALHSDLGIQPLVEAHKPLHETSWYSREQGNLPLLAPSTANKTLLVELGNSLLNEKEFDDVQHHTPQSVRALNIENNTYDLIIITCSSFPSTPKKTRDVVSRVLSHCSKRIRSGGEIHFYTDDLNGAITVSDFQHREMSRIMPWEFDAGGSLDFSPFIFRHTGMRCPLHILEIRRIAQDQYEARIDGRTIFASMHNRWMKGQRPRPRAALYDILANSLRLLIRDGVREVLINHHGDLQPELIQKWTPRKSYLQTPIRRVRALLRSLEYVRFSSF